MMLKEGAVPSLNLTQKSRFTDLRIAGTAMTDILTADRAELYRRNWLD